MGSLETRMVRMRQMNKISTVTSCDPEPLPFSHHSSPLPDEGKNAVTEDSGDTIPCEDVNLSDTQEVDFDDETQLADSLEDTVIMDLAGETQVMDDFDFNEHVDTQLLDLSDDETDGKSNGDVEKRTQLLHDMEGSVDIQLQERNGDQTNAWEKGTHCHQDDRRARSESLPSNDAAETSGRDIQRDSEKGLSNGNKRTVARSLARKLFMEEEAAEEVNDVAEEGSSDKLSGGMMGLSHLPADDNVPAGLSYVDSQEPGELSQENALQFIDKFLKVNVLDSDQDMTRGKAVGEIVNPGAIAKGPQSLAQQANRISKLAGASVFDWDDNREDDGGGEFFTKKKEMLLGTGSKASKSCSKPRSSRLPRGSRCLGKFRNQEKQDVCEKKSRFLHFNSKLITSGAIDQSEEINLNKKVHNDEHQQLGLDPCSGEMIAAAPNAECTDFQDVGFDTQMAAEAMEALSTASALLTNDGNLHDQGGKNGRGMPTVEEKKVGVSEKKSVKKRPQFSKSDRVTRSKGCTGIGLKSDEVPKCSISSRTRSRCIVGDIRADLLKPNITRRRSNRNAVSAANDGELDVAVNTNSKKTCGTVKRKRSAMLDVTSETSNAREETSNLTSVIWQSVARRTRSKRGTKCAEVAQDGKNRPSKAMLSSEDVCQLSSKKVRVCSPPAKGAVARVTLEGSPVETRKSSDLANITPVNLKPHGDAVSPVCRGDEYRTPSSKKRLSLEKELCRLTANELKYSSPAKDLRQRRDISSVRVLFSQHLDEDTVRQQKKILSRLGLQEASSILDATHFVADSFVRTRNMLEAIANGKPVVTHLWLESCGQASCFIDEKKYILRDAKKEKELGFCMPISLSRASLHPLLKDRRVLITPNIKPGKDIVSSLVKAVHGQVIERLSRNMLNNDKLLEDLLVLSCEEDIEFCVPLLEKGRAVYSSELLLHGIITQKLEYERYRLFIDHVKKTRSTLWVKKNGNHFLPVTRTK